MPDWKPHIRSRLASLRLSAARESEIGFQHPLHCDKRISNAGSVLTRKLHHLDGIPNDVVLTHRL